MEYSNSTVEESQFSNISATRQLDAANAKTGSFSAALSNSKPLGPTMALNVNRGDVVNLSVWAKAVTGGGSSTVVDASNFANALNSALTTQNLSIGETSSALTNGLAAGLAATGTGSNTNPTATGYLNYLVFDEAFNFTGHAGFLPATSTSYTSITLNNIVIEQNGYLIAWVSYESTSANRVFFDDFQVTLTEGTVLQQDDYYPFGLTFNSYTSGTENLYKYNGKEEQKETGCLDYGARMYDPALGRWNGIDFLADSYLSYSPYSYALNNPISLVDPAGFDVINGHEEEKKKAKERKDLAGDVLSSIDKGSNKKEWKKANREFNKANRSFNQVNAKFEIVQSSINTLKEVAPEIFNQLDNLEGPHGQCIDISVTALDSNESYWKDGEEYTLKGGTYAIPGNGSTSSYIINPISGARNTIGVKLKSGSAQVLAHEGGHDVYYSKNIRDYYYVLLKQNPGWATQGGHAEGDPNGIAATQMEKRYDALYRQYRKQIREQKKTGN